MWLARTSLSGRRRRAQTCTGRRICSSPLRISQLALPVWKLLARDGLVLVQDVSRRRSCAHRRLEQVADACRQRLHGLDNSVGSEARVNKSRTYIGLFSEFSLAVSKVTSLLHLAGTSLLEVLAKGCFIFRHFASCWRNYC